jgi:tetratricopeptide repeat protein
VLMIRLDQEIDNIRAALDWCVQSPDSVSEVLQWCTFPLYRYWDVRGSSNEARSRLERLLEQAPADAPVGAIAHTQSCLAHFYMLSGLPREAHERALAAAALARTADDPWSLIQTLLVCMIIHGLLHDFDQIPGICNEGLEVAKAIDHPFGAAPWYYWLGEVACMEGRLDEGERLLEECQRIVDSTGDSREISTVKFVQGHAAFLRGDLPRALWLFQETLRERYVAADAQVVPHCLDSVGWVASAQGDGERAVRLLGAAESAAVRGGVVLLPIWQADRDRAAAEVKSSLGDARFQELLEDGRALNLDQAVALALSEDV